MARLTSSLHLLGIGFRHHRLATVGLLVLALAEALVAPALAVVVGALLRAADSGGDLRDPLVAFAALVLVPVGEVRWRLAEQLGMRVGDVLDWRLMRAMLEPAGLAHLDDVELRDEAARAATFWNSSLLEGVVSVAVVRLSGALAAVVLMRTAGVVPAVLAASAWIGAGWWSWRMSARALDAQFDKAPELREVEYLSELSLSPAPGKDVRILGLGPWIVGRQLRLWDRAMTPVWRSRRRAIPGSVAVALGVAVLNMLAVLLALRSGIDGPTAATAFSALLAVVGLGEIPFGHYEMEFGLRTVPANAAVVEAVRSPRFRLVGTRTADGLPQQSIRFEEVSFSYPGDDRLVLDRLDLELVAGTSTAIVGVNGAGKSTLVKLLCRFYDPVSGAVTVDGNDLREFDARSWQNRVAGLFQDYVRYPLSARDNIALRASEAADAGEDEAVLAAAAAAGIGDELMSLPGGLETKLTRAFGGGEELSGGQWQRIALARAIHAVRRGAGVLVLDEPTAHLDARAEAELYDRFLAVTHGVTTVLVSHRFSTVRQADRIAVVDGGTVREIGSHDELVAMGGAYARLFALQAAMFRGESDAG